MYSDKLTSFVVIVFLWTCSVCILDIRKIMFGGGGLSFFNLIEV